MMENFEFNNINSETFGIVCTSIARPLIPSIKTRAIELNGQSGLYDFGGDEYESFILTMNIVYVGDGLIEIRNKGREIASWLNTKQWGKLIIGDEPDKRYLARVSGRVDLETLKTIGKANISLICQPFAYMVIDTDDNLTWDEADFPWITEVLWIMGEGYKFSVTSPSNIEFDNTGTKEINFRSPQGSKFDIRINGSFTTLSLTLNGKTLNYNLAVASGTVTIDNVNMEVDLNGVNKLNVISGDIATFLTTMPGSNILNVTGTNLNVEITIDFSPMWI